MIITDVISVSLAVPRLTVRTAWFVHALRLCTVSDDCSNLLMPRVRGLRLRTVSDDCLITVSAHLCACQRALICMLVGVVQLD